MPCVDVLQLVALLDGCYGCCYLCCGGCAARVWVWSDSQVTAARLKHTSTNGAPRISTYCACMRVQPCGSAVSPGNQSAGIASRLLFRLAMTTTLSTETSWHINPHRCFWLNSGGQRFWGVATNLNITCTEPRVHVRHLSLVFHSICLCFLLQLLSCILSPELCVELW
jgi:hypothetical protein